MYKKNYKYCDCNVFKHNLRVFVLKIAWLDWTWVIYKLCVAVQHFEILKQDKNRIIFPVLA